jgi:secreted trypsin-like serine protease
MSKPVSEARRRTLVAQAIRHAENAAPKDDAAFLAAFRAHALERMPPPSGGRALSIGAGGPRRAPGPRLADDPRYLAGVRALARRTAQNARIIGGSTVVGTEFDDCVAVGDDASWGCTGTLIAPNVVLTAGHCEVLHTRVFVGNNVARKGRQVRVARHVRHPGWTTGLRNDVMLLILDKPVPGVKPRAMAPSKLIDAATDARVVGFGTTDVGGTTGYGVKQQTDVPIVSPACRGRVKGRGDAAVYGCHAGQEIVAGKPLLLHDTCRGDSGGPLYIADAQGRWFLAGVTSRGTDLATDMCGDGGLYTRVDKYRAWIEKTAAQAVR